MVLNSIQKHVYLKYNSAELISTSLVLLLLTLPEFEGIHVILLFFTHCTVFQTGLHVAHGKLLVNEFIR